MGTLLLVGLAVLALYLLACVWRPFGACRKCRGAGRFDMQANLHLADEAVAAAAAELGEQRVVWRDI